MSNSHYLFLFLYRQFHKTLPRSSAFLNWISVRFYETDCIVINAFCVPWEEKHGHRDKDEEEAELLVGLLECIHQTLNQWV